MLAMEVSYGKQCALLWTYVEREMRKNGHALGTGLGLKVKGRDVKKDKEEAG